MLILSGMYGVPEHEQQSLTDLEVLLDLNMAACKLKLNEFKEAIDQCKMVTQQYTALPVAYFISYSISEYICTSFAVLVCFSFQMFFVDWLNMYVPVSRHYN